MAKRINPKLRSPVEISKPQKWAQERNWMLARIEAAKSVLYPAKRMFPEKQKQIDLIENNIMDLLKHAKKYNSYNKYTNRNKNCG